MSFLGGYDQNDSEQFQIVDPLAPPVFVDSVVDRNHQRRPLLQPRQADAGPRPDAERRHQLLRRRDGERRADQEHRRRPDLVEAGRQRVAVFVLERVVYDSPAFPSPRSSPSPATSRSASCRGRQRRASRSSIRCRRRRPLASSTGWAAGTHSTAASATTLQRYSGQESSGNNTSTGATIEFSGRCSGRRPSPWPTATRAGVRAADRRRRHAAAGRPRDPGRHELQQAAVAAAVPRSSRSPSAPAARTAATGGDAVGYTFWAPLGFGVGPRRFGRTWRSRATTPRHDGAVGPDARSLQLRCVQRLARRLGRTASSWCSSAAWPTARRTSGSPKRATTSVTPARRRPRCRIGGHVSALVDYSCYSYEVNGTRRCHRRCRRTSSGAPSARASRWACRSSAESLSDRRRDSPCCLDASTRPIRS